MINTCSLQQLDLLKLLQEFDVFDFVLIQFVTLTLIVTIPYFTLIREFRSKADSVFNLRQKSFGSSSFAIALYPQV